MLSTKYQKLEPRCHVLQRPGMYVGSVESERACVFLYDAERKAMEKREIDYIPGLYKIFDEIVTNAIDHATRLQQQHLASTSTTTGAEESTVARVRNIRVDIDRSTGWIEVFNDGDGIDVAMHPEHELWIPEMIFGHMLTSANYDDESGEERVVGGQNGLGAKCCNIFSRTFELETVDATRHKIYTQTFSNNMADKTQPVIKSCRKKPYTRVRFLPDYERFGLPGGLSDDMAALFAKRVTDACALTAADVNVYLNGTKLEAKTFERYADMYLGGRTEHPRVYEKVGDRFEVVATYNTGTGLEHVSFVNGVWTLRGGRHVDYLATQVSRRVCELLQQRRKMEHLKPQHVKDRLMLFVRCTIPNAAFDSQSKETMTTPVSKWGSKPEMSDGFYDRLCKTGIAELLQEASDDAASKALKQTDGKKKTVLRGIPKLHDAADAGTKKSQQCSLILTEGDSALAMAISGRSVVGSSKWGAMPLKGKLINVRDASNKKIADNEELNVLKKILGLESGRKYEDASDLRYGRIVIMSDQDPDGAHIRALVCNWIACQWPSLLAQPGFVTTLLTPIVKAYKTGEPALEFYCLPDYERWKRDNDTKGWRIKYYKGLATSTSVEAKEYFKKMRLVEYRREDEADDEALDLAFNRKRADERKAWLEAYDESKVLDYERAEVSYRELVHRDLVHFSQYDLERSIPSMVDGLKVSQRKVLYACFASNLVRGEVRVSTLASDTTARAHYNHGETSLQGAIVGMAQDFVGSNNVNLLQPNGQFGCLAPDTEVLRWDGSVAQAKDIAVGDLLVGDDGAPRRVLRTTSGMDDMYRVSMLTGESYVVNSQHILTLRRNDTFDIVDIKLTDFLALPAAERDGYSAVKNTVPIGWTEEERARICNAWLGEGRPGMLSGSTGTLIITARFPIRVEELEYGPFCGWQVDGNERFLLADFTVTHNSRLQGGKDAGSPRYIHTLLSPATPRIFPRADDAVLEWREDDGHRVEPRHYAPILPMVLVNGALGIGTGFSTSVPSYDPRTLMDALRSLLTGERAPEELPEPVPWYRGFKGRIEETTTPGKYVSHGAYERIAPTKLRITELPVGTWTEDYKLFLEELCEKCADLKGIDNEYTDEVAQFVITFASEGALTSRLASPADFETEFKLVSRPITTSNMYLYNEKGQIRKYASARDIIAAYYRVRLDYYGRRREAVLAQLEAESVVIGAKVRFIQSVIDGEVVLYDADAEAVAARLEELAFPKQRGDADGGDYDYLLRMAMSSVTAERKRVLLQEHERLMARIERLRGSTPASLWLEELDALATVLDK